MLKKVCIDFLFCFCGPYQHTHIYIFKYIITSVFRRAFYGAISLKGSSKKIQFKKDNKQYYKTIGITKPCRVTIISASTQLCFWLIKLGASSSHLQLHSTECRNKCCPTSFCNSVTLKYGTHMQ